MKNYQTALERYREAAEDGDMAAGRKLGKVLLEEGLRYLEAAALSGDAEALEILSGALASANKLLYKGQKQDGRELPSETDFSRVHIGDVVFFGRHVSKDEPISWQVLAVQEGRVLLLSKDILEYRAFHEKWGLVTWERASIRKYLNGDFLARAFSDKERFIIATTKVEAHENPMCNTDPGRDTRDKVFLLSAVEAEKYFPVNLDRRCFYCFADRKAGARAGWWRSLPAIRGMS